MPAEGSLGPIDKPQDHPGKDDERISSQDSLNSPELIKQEALQDMVDVVAELTSQGLDIDKALDHGRKFAIDFWKPVMSKKDPDIMYRSHRRQQIGGRLAIDLYTKHIPDQREDEEIISSLQDAIRLLVAEFPDHGYSISRNTVGDLLAEVEVSLKEAEKRDDWDKIYNDFFMESREQKLIKLID
ncbi:MAG: hypothetical protein ABEJ98_04450 [Candidatus Nanohaloarchaea archaeon]